MEEEKEDNKTLKIIRFTAKGDESGNGLCPVLLFPFLGLDTRVILRFFLLDIKFEIRISKLETISNIK